MTRFEQLRWHHPYELIVAALALAFVAAQVPFLPQSPDDIDSANLALGLREFDVAAHQPHPPGYPVVIGLGRLALAVAARLPWLAGAPRPALEAHALAIWGVLGGAVAAFALFYFFFALERSKRLAVEATALTLACPLFWFTAGRPVTDVIGLAVGLVAVAFAASAFRRRPGRAGSTATRDAPGGLGGATAPADRLIIASAFVAGVSLGVRAQNAWIALPLLMIVGLDRVGRGAGRVLGGSLAAFVVGVALWAVPLLGATGGPVRYTEVVVSQVAEDMEGVDMLAMTASMRRLAFALVDTFVAPWSDVVLASLVLGLAVAGGLVMAWGSRTGLALLVAATLPYGLFHLAFQETATTRYALPLVPAVAYLAVRGLAALAGRLSVIPMAGAVAACLSLAVPNAVAYASASSPAFRAVDELRHRAAARPDRPRVAMHQGVSIAVRGEPLSSERFASPPGREWLELVNYWRDGGSAPVWFLARSRRTDLALIDPQSRHLVARYRWPLPHADLLKGVRPFGIDWYEIANPGWFLSEGWALTPETAGVARRGDRGPHKGPIVAYVRRRSEASVLLIGGRHLGARGEPEARFTLSLDGRPVAEWTAAPDPGFFLQRVDFPAGALTGDGQFARLALVSRTVGPGPTVRTAAEQFDLQSAGTPLFAYDRGWHELEYNPASGRLWRWTSARSDLLVEHGGRDLTLVFDVESPLRYFAAPPRVVVRAGRVLARAEPTGDFTLKVRLVADVLDAAGGRVTVETSRTYSPAERSQGPDRRRLGLRVRSVTLSPAS